MPKAQPGRKLQLRKPPAQKEAVGLLDSGASAGGFYDSGWREKRESGYTSWINFMLCEPTMRDAASADAGERQRLSLRQLEEHRYDALLRRRAVLLLRGTALRPLLTRLEQQVDSGLICVRPPINLVADVGLRANLLNLLGCYNPLWLRFALEAVTSELAPRGAALDDAGLLRRFIDKRMLAAPQGVAPPAIEGQHPEEATKRAHTFARDSAHRLIVKRVLSVMLLLDAAKEQALLQSDPCLFCPASSIKTTRAMVTEFCRSYLSGGIGDLAKHLGTLGAPLSHAQSALHEYNFRVDSLATDLRDGARLCRLVELVSLNGERSIVSSTRLPAGSRLQKMHNAMLATKVSASIRH